MSLSVVNPSTFYFFFFQAEDGIRDDLVTGVQTCALPIYRALAAARARSHTSRYKSPAVPTNLVRESPLWSMSQSDRKSEVSGKSVDLGGRRIIEEKERR